MSKKVFAFLVKSEEDVPDETLYVFTTEETKVADAIKAYAELRDFDDYSSQEYPKERLLINSKGFDFAAVYENDEDDVERVGFEEVPPTIAIYGYNDGDLDLNQIVKERGSVSFSKAIERQNRLLGGR